MKISLVIRRCGKISYFLAPNPITIRVVTLPAKDVSDRNRQKLRFPEISKRAKQYRCKISCPLQTVGEL